MRPWNSRWTQLFTLFEASVYVLDAHLLSQLQELHPLSEDLGVPLSQFTHHRSFPLLHGSPQNVSLLLCQCFGQLTLLQLQAPHPGFFLLLQSLKQHGLQLQDPLVQGQMLSVRFYRCDDKSHFYILIFSHVYFVGLIHRLLPVVQLLVQVALLFDEEVLKNGS